MKYTKIIFALTLFISALFLNGCETNNDKTSENEEYLKLEKQLKTAATEFFKNNTQLLSDDESVPTIVSISNLYDGFYIEKKLVDPNNKKNECNEAESTITATKKGEVYEYDVYLICGDYKTLKK